MNTRMLFTALKAPGLFLPYSGWRRFMLTGLLMSGTAIPVLAVETASPATATQADCQQAAMAINQGMKSHMPANPEVAQTILNLKHQGDTLCQQESYKDGLGKLHEASAILDAPALPVTPLPQ